MLSPSSRAAHASGGGSDETQNFSNMISVLIGVLMKYYGTITGSTNLSVKVLKSFLKHI